jgi:hypothetical protein
VLLFPQDGFVLECGLMDYGYGLIIDGCGCVDFWTIWIWFFFLCCESNNVVSVGEWTCRLWTMDYGLFEYGLIF